MPSTPRCHISVLAHRRDPELERIHATLTAPLEADGRNDLAELLGRAVADRAPSPPIATTLDLIGHSMPGTSLLRLGDWVIDAAQSSVIAFFRELAEYEVLPRLGFDAVRLLGCVTAGTAHARYTICALADILGVEVYGTTDLVSAAHYDPTGFSDRYAHILVASRDLRGEPPRFEARTTAGSGTRAFDLDALPAVAIATMAAASWPRHVLDRDTASEVLRMIRRGEGAEMPGLLAQPTCELALPSQGGHVAVQVLLDGEFIRVFPRPDLGILYPVAEVRGLRRLLLGLAQPVASPARFDAA